MLSLHTTPPSKMFFTIVNYFTSQYHHNDGYTPDTHRCCIVVEPHLIDIEKGRYN